METATGMNTGMKMGMDAKRHAGTGRCARRRGGALALAITLLALAGCGEKKTAAEDAVLSAAEAQYLSDENLWRIQRQEKLTAADGWTSLIGLHWLTLKSHYAGSSPRSGIRLAMGPPSMGMFTRDGNRVFFTPDSGVPLTLDGAPLKGRVELKDDSAGAPSVVGFDEGKGLLTVIERAGNRALRVKHADAPTRLQFKGLEYWPPNRDWRIEATFIPHPAGTTLPIATIIGTTENTSNPGALEFQREGKTFRIEALDQGGETLSLIIADRTSGHETYGAGRYLDVPRPDAKGKVVIDFNRAYNPPCAFTQFATCPLPPNQNRLDLAITAGEKRYGVKH
jgi:uncharacterized protein (DUF1684 family)